MSTDTDYEPVKVHVASAAPGALNGTATRRKRASCRPYTVVLTSTNPVQTILDLDDSRSYALVQAGGFDVVINNSNGEAQNAANQVSGLPDPVGMVLSCGNTAPTRIPGGERWWAAAAEYPAQVTVLVVQED